MLKFRNALCHSTIILSAMFLVFLILEQYNPMKAFIDTTVSNFLLALLCISAITQSILTWILSFHKRSAKPNAKAIQNSMMQN